MTYLSKISKHEAAAQREEEAARRAAAGNYGHLHTTLAELHRQEARKLASIGSALEVALGE